MVWFPSITIIVVIRICILTVSPCYYLATAELNLFMNNCSAGTILDGNYVSCESCGISLRCCNGAVSINILQANQVFDATSRPSGNCDSTTSTYAPQTLVSATTSATKSSSPPTASQQEQTSSTTSSPANSNLVSPSLTSAANNSLSSLPTYTSSTQSSLAQITTTSTSTPLKSSNASSSRLPSSPGRPPVLSCS